MKNLITALFLATFLNSFGQFAVVSDKDGFVNVRKEARQNSKVTDKLENGHFIYCFEPKENWINIDYSKKEKKLNGYVYKDRYKLISSFQKFDMVSNTNNKVVLGKDDIQIIITQSRFEKNKHQFKYVKNYPTQIELIDGKKYFGTDGEMPVNQFEKIEIKIGSKIVVLPKSALENLYEPSLYNAEVNYDQLTSTFYIQTQNSDGAGSYLVVWRVEKGIYKDRFIAYGF